MDFPDSHGPAEQEERCGASTPRRFLEILRQDSAALLQLNLIFLLACLPLVTIPPAALALSRMVRALIADEAVRPWPHFWASFRRDWRQGYAAFLLTALPLAGAGYGARFYLRFAPSNPLFYLPFMICSTVFLAALLASGYLYALLSDGRSLSRETLRRALAFGLARPLRSVLAAALWYGPLLAGIFWFPMSGIYLLLIGFSVPCLLAHLSLRRALEQLGQ